MYLRYFLTVLAILTAASISVPDARAQSADVIISNGKILTVDPVFSIAHSLAIRNGRIIAVGTAQAVAGHKGPNTRVIDLSGKTVIPGLIDNHFHFIRSVWNFQREVRLDGVMSRAKALARWLMACLASGSISPKVRAAPSGRNMGS